MYYKVLNEDLKSLGMKPKGRQVPIIQYVVGKWVYPLEPISKNSDKGGGLWVNLRKGQAIGIARRLWKEKRRRVRVFVCLIGKILCQPSDYRLKTDKVMLLKEIPVHFLYIQGLK